MQSREITCKVASWLCFSASLIVKVRGKLVTLPKMKWYE